jgi:hypothetical protein
MVSLLEEKELNKKLVLNNNDSKLCVCECLDMKIYLRYYLFINYYITTT